MTPLETELLNATSVKSKKGEDRQAYLFRLIEAANDVPDEDYKALSKEAKKWITAGVEAHNNNSDIPDFPKANGEDTAEEDESASAAETTTTQEDTVDAKTEKKKAAKKTDKAPKVAKAEKPAPEKKAEKAPKKEKAAKAPKATKSKENGAENKPARRTGAQTMIKKLVLKDPTISTESVVEKCLKAGYKISPLAASTIRSGFRHSLKVIQEEGLLKSIKL